MTSRRLIFNVLKCVGLMVAAALALHWFTQRTPFDRAHFDQIRAGMSRAEVENVLGGPARNECRDRVVVWLPKGESAVSYELRPEAPVSSFFPGTAEGSEERLWVGEEGLIAALFGEDGRLVEKYYSDVHVTPRPSAADTIRHVMGR
jgi:hypothetical protein